MSRRRSRRPDGIVYRQLRKNRPGTHARKRRLMQIEIAIMVTFALLIGVGVWWFFLRR